MKYRTRTKASTNAIEANDPSLYRMSCVLRKGKLVQIRGAFAAPTSLPTHAAALLGQMGHILHCSLSEHNCLVSRTEGFISSPILLANFFTFYATSLDFVVYLL
jgi:hypothetical protein